MKIKFYIFIMVFILCAAMLMGSFHVLSQAQDDVTVEERVLYGDPSAAKGLVITERTAYYDGVDMKMIWDTRYHFGEVFENSTAFRISSEWDITEMEPKVDLTSDGYKEMLENASEQIGDVSGVNLQQLFGGTQVSSAWDGERLAVVALIGGWESFDSTVEWAGQVLEEEKGLCDFMLLICGKDGAEYLGRYKNSQSLCIPTHMSNLMGDPPDIIYPVGRYPLSVEWYE